MEMSQELSVRENHNNGLIDPAAMAAAETAKQLIQAAFIMAAQRPRNIDQSRIDILQSCKRPAFAARVEYGKPVGGKIMRGPSIRFAEAAIRMWGNIRSDVSVVYEDTTVRRIRVTLLDLQTNSAFNKEITIAKTVERSNDKGREVIGKRLNTSGQIVYIVLATDDELANKESAAISKVIRNEGLRLIPADIIDEAMETARQTLEKGDGDPEATRKRMLDSFADLGIKPTDLEKYLGHTTDQLVPAEMAELRGMYQAIRDGEARWSDYMEIKTGKDGEQVAQTTASINVGPYTKAAATPPPAPKKEQPEAKQVDNSTTTQPHESASDATNRPTPVTTKQLMDAVRISKLPADLLNAFLIASKRMEPGKTYMDASQEVKRWIVDHHNLSAEVSAWVDSTQQ